MRNFLLLLFSLASLQAMTLEESIDCALKNNNSLKQSDVAIERFKALRDNKDAQNYGRLDLMASYDHYNMPRTLAPLTPVAIFTSPNGPGSIPTTKDLFTAGIAYNVTLFDGFARKNAYDISDLQYQNAAIKSKLGREELIYNVRTLYITLLALQEQLDAQRIYTASKEKLLANIKHERLLGSKARIDELKAQNSLEASRAKESTMEAGITSVKAALSSLMGGKEFDSTVAVKITVDDTPKMENDKYDISSLKRCQAADIDIKASAKKREQSKAGYYPKIDFNAYYGQNLGPNDTTNHDPSTGSVIIDKGDWNNQEIWQLGLKLKWNILDFGNTSTINQEAMLSHMNARLKSEGVQIELRKNITTAQSDIRLAAAQYKSALSQFELLSETEKIEHVRYENDALTLTDLLATSAEKELAHAQMLNAKYSYQKAKYYLDYLLEKGEDR